MQLRSIVDSLPVGSRLAAVRRIFFVIGERIDSTEGPIELTFDCGQSFLFECGSDGEMLVISPKRWIDPFVEPVSVENAHYLLGHGKWEVLDLGSVLWSYRRFLGQKLSRVDVASDSHVILRFEKSTLDVIAEDDELHVSFVGEQV